MQSKNFIYKVLIYSCTFLCILLSRQASKADIISVPIVIVIGVNGESAGGSNYNLALGPSRLSVQTRPNTSHLGSNPSNDYLINGAVYTNCPSLICTGSNGIMVEVQPLRVIMQNGSSEIAVNLRGTIGNKSITSGLQSADLLNLGILSTLPWQSNVQVIGDIDESTVSIEDRPGGYFGSFTIKAYKY
ncbi:MAG: hypothetical protein SFU25_07870 [Candidatus Caenarcaniphilales bacterium]|nr:hypothetical protein [Candidatus Caenarcaniphilales bacterium]